MTLAAIGKRLISLVVVLIAVSFLTMASFELLPGDPALSVLPTENVSPEQLEAVRKELGLDRNIVLRYVDWVGDALTGDLGRSFRTNQAVSTAIAERFPVTLQLGLMAIGTALLVSIPLGTLVAYRAGGRIDRAVTALSFGLLSIPNFVLALVLIIVFAVKLGWLPSIGWVRISENLTENLKSAALPAASLAIGEIAVYTRLLRTDMIATLQEDHVLLARSKGLPTWQILFRHALRPSSFSLMTVVGVNIGAILGGTVIIETIFALPGLGKLLVDSIFARDLIIVQGVVVLISASFVIVNFIVDLLYTFLDPRIRHAARPVG